MSFAVDANILLYASDESSRFHDQARAAVDCVASGPEIAYLFWPTAMAYLRIATHPAIFARPLSAKAAIANLESLLDRPHVQSPGEQPDFWTRFRALASDVPPTGKAVPDTHLVALMLQNGVATIWTHDRDFRRFRGIRVHDPFED